MKLLIALMIQLLIFYVYPAYSAAINGLELVLTIIILTFLLSIIFGIIVDNDEMKKFLYPIIIAILFIPSVFIYYNESALIHSIWYLVISFVGITFGSMIRGIYNLFS